PAAPVSPAGDYARPLVAVPVEESWPATSNLAATASNLAADGEPPTPAAFPAPPPVPAPAGVGPVTAVHAVAAPMPAPTYPAPAGTHPVAPVPSAGVRPGGRRPRRVLAGVLGGAALL